MKTTCLETEQAPASPASPSPPDDFVVRYVRHVEKHSLSMLSFWACSSVVLWVFGAAKLMAHTRNEFDPPLGSASQVARELMRDRFPRIGATHTDIVYFEVAKGHYLNDDLLQGVTIAVNDALQDLLADDLFTKVSVTGFISTVANGFPQSAARAQFISHHNVSSFLVVQYPKQHTMKYGRALQGCLLRLRAESVMASHQLSFVGGGGNALQSVEAVDEGSRSMKRMDLVSVPLAFVIFGFSVSSIRLLVVPFLTLVVGCITAFGILGLLARAGLSVSSATPPLMMSMLLAVSIDYALFLLARFKEEIETGASIDVAVVQMLLHSGHTVCGSGFTLAFCFLALLFFPVHMMQSIGVGVVVSILSAILVNLTLVPAILLACPKFFANTSVPGRSTSRDHVVSPLTDDADQSQSSRAFEATVWFRWSLFATSTQAAVLALFTLLLVGGLSMVRCKSMQHSMDTWLLAPRVSISLESFQLFSRSFSIGNTAPFQLLLLPSFNKSSSCPCVDASSGIYSEPFWANATALLQGVVSELYDSPNSANSNGMLHSIMYVYNMRGNGFETSPTSHGQPTTFSMPMKFVRFLDPKATVTSESKKMCNGIGIFLSGLRGACHKFLATKRCKDLAPMATMLGRLINIPKAAVSDACIALQFELRSSSTSERDAVFATLVPAVLDRSTESVEWTRRCRQFLVANAKKYPCLEAHLNGITPQMVDAIDSIYSRAPAVLAITMALCLLLVSFWTVSLAFGVSAVGLIGWTLLVVFAIADIVYRGNILAAFFGSPSFVSGTEGLAWIVPPLTFSMIFGLGLDYNIFLLGRVCEYHDAGLGDREAIALGVAKTGPVINSAGLIMAVAFSGMMLSSIPMMNQVSFLLVTAVLIDTFFVRSLATPALHAPLKVWNWWPRNLFNR